ncbi:hypothetical protein BHC44_04965 [Snodgrassella alvi]|jgi:hypothetical protein|uniref:DUF4124 domain-containing protein n=1 Tax=Snodgrassella alvi TaxID=1196083 RepID=A0A2N9XZC0_9NEIS|nr:hypothetical protein [Snodgrassella alvi]PIT53999.1 hypothetical protein BHC44_04965 [Snodgrassella alvi]PIT56628.1 hypothetical protein BHC49_04270 [Snodgrassella alvi]
MTYNKFLPILILTGSLFMGHSAYAKVYTCLENGEIVYTSKPKGNCAVANLPPIGSYSDSRRSSPSAAIRSRPRPATRVATAYSGPQPTVNIVPKGSDNTRRAILQQELTNERNALAQAQQALNRSRTGKGGNITELQSAVLDRQQNIQAIQRELGRM